MNAGQAVRGDDKTMGFSSFSLQGNFVSFGCEPLSGEPFGGEVFGRFALVFSDFSGKSLFFEARCIYNRDEMV